MFYAFLFGMLPLAALTGFMHGIGTWQLSSAAWAVLLLLSLGPTLGGFMLYTIGLSYLPASTVTLLGTLEPVFSIVLAYLLFGEVLNLTQLIGAGLILWSVVMLRPR
jgi:drug/metabolite transporter (DMT)-like permease